MSATWSKHSWKKREVVPCYPQYDVVCEAELENIYQEMEAFPTLLSPSDIVQFREELEAVARGEKLLLHIGDCSEEFAHSSAPIVREKVAFYLRICKALEEWIGQEVVCLGRIAGQYAKSRSSPTERRGEVEHASYFGDIYNGFSTELREVVPARMVEAYRHAKEVIAHVKGDVFVSHEGLNLYYESALTRKQEGKWWNLSTHLPWLGWRSFHSKAHVSYLQGIANPIGIKVGPQFDAVHLVLLLERLNPENAPAKIVLIYRFGLDHIKQELSRLLQLVAGYNVLLIADVMHGNTHSLHGNKMRFTEEIAEELAIASRHAPFHGMHLEAAPGPILECISKRDPLSQQVIQTTVDLRLNEAQSLEVVKSCCAKTASSCCQ